MNNFYLEYFIEESDNYVLEKGEEEPIILNNLEVKNLIKNSNFELEYIDIDTYEFIKGKINRMPIIISVL